MWLRGQPGYDRNAAGSQQETSIPIGSTAVFQRLAGTRCPASLDVQIVETVVGELGADRWVVVAAIEMEGLDVAEQARRGDVVERRPEELHVVAVGAVDGPADGDAVRIGGNRPLPAQFRPVCGVLSRAGSLVQGPVEGDVRKVEADDPVVGSPSFAYPRGP